MKSMRTDRVNFFKNLTKDISHAQKQEMKPKTVRIKKKRKASVFSLT